ncbi:hypothetical protein F2Q68_00019834 [Brassica cretica]|uniref:Uncharacterized protein n=1 Tax=Brassica cretica TaxID=69181 RepID=A0A8S9G2K8_BRACR|nr:hypothetical protein F2Q68_00019834 [Brassica cretica]
MKRNQGSEDLDSEKKPLLQSLHLPNVFENSCCLHIREKEVTVTTLLEQDLFYRLVPLVSNGYGSPRSLSAVEDRYLIRLLRTFLQVLPGTFLIISFIGTTADKHREDHKPQEQP